MRFSVLPRALLTGLILCTVLGPPARAETESNPPAKKEPPKGSAKRTISPKAETPQTQTAPAAGAEKAKPAPGEAGEMTVQGKISGVRVERNAVIVQSAASEFQVFISPQSQVIRDGLGVDIKGIHAGDRVDSCHYNAKHVVQKMILTSPEKSALPDSKGKP